MTLSRPTGVKSTGNTRYFPIKVDESLTFGHMVWVEVCMRVTMLHIEWVRYDPARLVSPYDSSVGSRFS